MKRRTRRGKIKVLSPAPSSIRLLRAPGRSCLQLPWQTPVGGRWRAVYQREGRVKRGWKELGGLITPRWGTMQITDYLSEVVTSTPSQSLGDADLEPRKSLPPPRSTAPTALAAATEFPNCGRWKCPSVPVWHGAPVARRGKKSLSDHPAGKAKKAGG